MPSRVIKKKNVSSGTLSKMKEKKDPNNRFRHFNPKQDYDYILINLKSEFDFLWDQTTSAPNTGLSDYVPVTELSKGAFGIVILVREISTNLYFACKVLEKEHIVLQKQETHLLSERKILTCINFPNLIKLIFASKDNDCLYIGMPYIIGGDMFDHIFKVRCLNESDACFYAAQVYLALEYLHNCQILYRDLKTENICLEQNGYITLIDFGFAKRVTNRTLTFCGTPEYLAPELIKSIPYATSVDWWAFGILIYEFVHGNTPFHKNADNPMRMYELIIAGNYIIPGNFSYALRGFIKNLLQTDMTKRLGNANRKEIKYHDFFKNVDWFAILNQKIRAPYIPQISGKNDTSHFHTHNITMEFNKSEINRYEEIFADF